VIVEIATRLAEPMERIGATVCEKNQ
jgi:hypothetical protein